VDANNVKLHNFLKILSDALSKHSIDNLTDALERTIGSVKYSKDDIETIFELVSTHYNISVKALKQTKQKGVVVDAKHHCYCLMNLELKLPVRFIAKQVFSNNFVKVSHMSVYKGIKRFRELNPKLREDKIFLDNYVALREKFYNTKSK